MLVAWLGDGCMSPVTVVGTLNGAHSVHAHGTGEWRVEPILASQGLRRHAHQGTPETMPLTWLESKKRALITGSCQLAARSHFLARLRSPLVPLPLVPPLEGSHLSHPSSD